MFVITLVFEGEILLTAGGGKQSYFIPNINVNIYLEKSLFDLFGIKGYQSYRTDIVRSEQY